MPLGLDLPASDAIRSDLADFGTDVFDAVETLGLPVPGGARGSRD